MNKRNWTPEPWTIEDAEPKKVGGQAFTCVMALNDKWIDDDTPPYPLIAAIPHMRDGKLPESRKANAARIVACVNALENLNPQGVGELVDAAKGILKRLDIEADEHEPGAIFPCAAMREPLRAALAKIEEG